MSVGFVSRKSPGKSNCAAHLLCSYGQGKDSKNGRFSLEALQAGTIGLAPVIPLITYKGNTRHEVVAMLRLLHVN